MKIAHCKKLNNKQKHKIKIYVNTLFYKLKYNDDHTLNTYFYYGSLYENCYQQARLNFCKWDIASVIHYAKHVFNEIISKE